LKAEELLLIDRNKNKFPVGKFFKKSFLALPQLFGEIPINLKIDNSKYAAKFPSIYFCVNAKPWNQ